MLKQTQNKIQTIIGHKGYGKTALTEALTILNDKPAIICDPRFQFTCKQKRRIEFKSVGDFRKWIHVTANFRDFYKYKLELVVHAFDDTFQELGELVYKMKSLTFVVDEVDMFFDTKATSKNSLYKIIHYGRHSEIDLISTSRRPANISRNLTSQTDLFYFSKLREPTDKKYVKDAIGLEYVKVVETLEKFSFLKYEDDEKHTILTTSLTDLELLLKA